MINRVAIFGNGHYAADQIYFYESNYEKYANCHLQKIKDTLKTNFSIWKFANSFGLFTSRKINKKNIFNWKNGQIGFCPDQGKIHFFEFLFIFSFSEIQRRQPPGRRLRKSFILLFFKVTVKICRVGNLLNGFLSKLLVFCKKWANERFAQKIKRFLHLLIKKQGMSELLIF